MTGKRIIVFMLLLALAVTTAGCVKPAELRTGAEAVYLGVKDYGKEGIDKDHKNDFLYRFETNGRETELRIMNGTADEQGSYDYPIQNQLKEGYSYRLTVGDGTVTAVEEIRSSREKAFEPVVSGTVGEKTLLNFLKTALEPVGTTLYIYGGGWDWQDVGSSVQTRTIGVSPDWIRFFDSQDVNYTYKEKDGDEAKADPETSYYPYGGYNEYYYAGLDCSGYLGWVLYNTFETEDGREGYVGGSTKFARRLAEKGWGTWTQDVVLEEGANGCSMLPGDIMSINGHVWISLGTCSDGSTVILHSTPSRSRTGQPGGGVQISAIGLDEACEAYGLAERCMKALYPEWYERYPVYLCDPSVYFTFEGENAGRFTWDTSDESKGLKDPDGVQTLQPGELLSVLFGEIPE